MKKHVMSLEEDKQIYIVFFKRISQNKTRKMQEELDGFEELVEIFDDDNHVLNIKNESIVYENKLIYDNGINYARLNLKLRPLKIALFFCYNDCGSKFLGYFSGVNQRQYCKKCSHSISNFEDSE